MSGQQGHAHGKPEHCLTSEFKLLIDLIYQNKIF